MDSTCMKRFIYKLCMKRFICLKSASKKMKSRASNQDKRYPKPPKPKNSDFFSITIFPSHPITWPSKEPILSNRSLHTHWEETQSRRRNSDRSPNASIPCNGFFVLQLCEEHHGLTFALIEASLNVGGVQPSGQGARGPSQYDEGGLWGRVIV